MILYWVSKFLTNFFLRVYYRIEYRGLENIPRGQAMVFAPNHVNAFIDPVLTAMHWQLPKIRFFARGDVFRGKIARILLNDLNISPMYRIQEGYAELRKNDKTFEECRRLLLARKAILIHPEALCIQVRRARPLKKGLARIVFQTAEATGWKQEIYVVPVGLNYTAPKIFRSKCYVEIGEPLGVLAYREQYETDRVRAINDFTRDLGERLAAHLVNVADQQHEPLLTAIEEIKVHEWLGGRSGTLQEQYKVARSAAEQINRMSAEDPEMLAKIDATTQDYQRLVRKHGLRDNVLRPEKISRMNLGTFLLEYLVIYLGFLLYLPALALNYPPYWLAKRFADDKIASDEFYASVRANVSMLLWIVYYVFQLITVAIVTNSWIMVLVWTVLVPALGTFALFFYPVMKKILGRWKLLRMVRKERAAVEHIVELRAQVIRMLEAFRPL